MVPAEEASRKISESTRKHYEHDIRFTATGDDVNNPLRSAAYQTGPGGSHTASTWKTSYQSQCDADQRASKRKGKRLVTPAVKIDYSNVKKVNIFF